MSVKDMIKKSVLESGVFDQYNISSILVALVAALALGILIFLVYRRFYTGVIYSRTFAVTLVGMTVLTCMVTLAISTNVVISLGMVGALSIVRFRTAVKDPMDLLYLFWAITTGITDYSPLQSIPAFWNRLFTHLSGAKYRTILCRIRHFSLIIPAYTALSFALLLVPDNL